MTNYERTDHMNKKTLKLASDLKTLSDGYRRMNEYEEEYQERVKGLYLPDYDMFSEGFKNQAKAKLKAARDEKMSALAKKMQTALESVMETDALDGKRLDPTDARLASALNLVNTIGKEMSYEDQRAILDQFRGDLPALRIVGAAYRKAGLYAAKDAQELLKPLDSQAVEDMGRALAGYFYQGEWEKGNLRWTHGEFDRYAERLGLDIGGNPWEAQLARERDDAEEKSGIRAHYRALSAARAAKTAMEAIAMGQTGDPGMDMELGEAQFDAAHAKDGEKRGAADE